MEIRTLRYFLAAAREENMTEEFKHIKVTAAAEDDEVVVAGVSQETPQTAASAAPTKPREQREPRQPREDSYHETTLEDLERTPMPLAQRIIIIAAVVCIIGALVYYFTVMR